MDEYLIKQINKDLSNAFKNDNLSEKIIQDTINIIRNGYYLEDKYLNEEQLLSILCYKIPTAKEYTFHRHHLAKTLYEAQTSNFDFDNIASHEKQKYYTIISVVANQLNDTSLINRVKRVGNQFVYMNNKK